MRDSTTVVFGCEIAYFDETYLPVIALRALPLELLDLPLAMIHLLTVPNRFARCATPPRATPEKLPRQSLERARGPYGLKVVVRVVVVTITGTLVVLVPLPVLIRTGTRTVFVPRETRMERELMRALLI